MWKGIFTLLHFNQDKMTVLESHSARNKISNAASAQLACTVRKRYILRKQMTALKLWWYYKALSIFYIILTTLAHMVYAQEFNFLSFIFFTVLKICPVSKNEYRQLKNFIKLSILRGKIIRKLNICINILFTILSVLSIYAHSSPLLLLGIAYGEVK